MGIFYLLLKNIFPIKRMHELIYLIKSSQKIKKDIPESHFINEIFERLILIFLIDMI